MNPSCGSHKRIYQNRELAEEALIGARTRFSYTAGQGPVAVYQCDDCGFFHLTSKGPMNERLAKEIADGKIDRQKEADRWEERFRRK